MTRKNTIIITAIIVILLILFSYHFLGPIITRSNPGNTSYPQVTPYTVTKYYPGEFPISLDEAIKISNNLLKKAGIQLNDYYIERSHASSTYFGIKIGVAIIVYRNKYTNGSIRVWIDLIHGRPMYFDMYGPLVGAPDKCYGTVWGDPKEFAANAIKKTLEDFGFNMTAIDIKVLHIRDGGGWIDADYTFIIYGYPIDLSNYFPAEAVICPLPGGGFRVYRMSIPSPVIYIYHMGYFVKPPNPLPVDRDKAISLAVSYVKSHGQVTELRYKYRGVFWVFHKWNNTKIWDPVPRLEHYITFWVSRKGGGQYKYTVEVDAITGEVRV